MKYKISNHVTIIYSIDPQNAQLVKSAPLRFLLHLFKNKSHWVIGIGYLVFFFFFFLKLHLYIFKCPNTFLVTVQSASISSRKFYFLL